MRGLPVNFSSIYQKYDAMRQPNYQLEVGGSVLEAGTDARLLSAVCELTCNRQAGALCLEAALDPDGEHGAAWLDKFQLGGECSLSLGYGGDLTEVFHGFLYDLNWEDPLKDGAMGLSAVCLDVRGRLMLSSCADAGPKRSLSKLVNDILGQSCCTKLASTRTVNSPPEDWNLPVHRLGPTDYDVVCAAADFVCYEFYAFASELYFGAPRPVSSPTVTFDGPNGLMRLARGRTLAGQCAAVAVSGADDAGARIYSRQARESDSGFGTDSMGSVLTGDLHQPEAAVRTMAQAQYLARNRMARRQRQAGRLAGRCVGLPELRPGRFIEVSGMSEPVNGSYYVHTVRHVLDEAGFETSFEAED